MNFEQSSKDVRTSIGKLVDDRSIINFCLINSEINNKICNENFFRDILENRYPHSLKYKPKQMPFKKYYFLVIYYVDLLEREFGFDYKKYGREGAQGTYYVFKDLADPKNMDELLILATKGGKLSLVQYALNNGANIHANDEQAIDEA